MAHRTAGTMGSGGTAVLVRAGSGIAPANDIVFTCSVDHRISLAWADAVCKGGLHCMSLYLRCSETFPPPTKRSSRKLPLRSLPLLALGLLQPTGTLVHWCWPSRAG